MPMARSAIIEWRRSGSRAKMFDRCSSTIGLVAQRLHRVDQRALVVRLKPLDLGAERTRRVANHGLDLGQAGSPIELRLSLSQQVQVGTVEHRDPHF